MTYWMAAVATLAALAVASPASARADRIEVVARVQQAHTAHLPPYGRAGDATSGVLVVRDRWGRTIGDLSLDCRWVTAGLRLCVAQLSMPLGAIALVGASRTSFIGQLAVVGGTGEYQGAAGTLLFREIGEGAYVLSVQYRR